MRAYEAWDTAEAIAGFIQNIFQDQQDFTTAVLMGDSAEINRLGEKYGKAFEYSVEILEAIRDEVLNMDAFEGGRIVGRVVGEMILMLATAGVGYALKGASIANVLTKLKGVSYIADAAPVLNKLDTVVDFAQHLASTKMCFVAGTMVQTPDGPKAIETIRVGDLVLTRDEETGEQCAKAVLETFVTNPDWLCHLR
jgi:hypothetical protein